MYRSFHGLIPLLAFAVVGSRGERHSVGFDNACGFGQPILVDGTGNVLSNGNVHTNNGPVAGRAFLQTGDCGAQGERCTVVEMNLGAAASFADIALMDPFKFSVATAFRFVNGCDGQGASCPNEDCPQAIRSPSDDSAIVACQNGDVDIVISFCGGTDDDSNPAPPGSQDPDPGTSTTEEASDPETPTPTPTPTPTTDSSPTENPEDDDASPTSDSTSDNPTSNTSGAESGSEPTETPTETGSHSSPLVDPSNSSVIENTDTLPGSNAGGDDSQPGGAAPGEESGSGSASENKKDGGGMSKGAIIGTAMASAVFTVLMLLGILFCLKRRRRNRKQQITGRIYDDEERYYDAPGAAHPTISPYHVSPSHPLPFIHPDKVGPTITTTSGAASSSQRSLSATSPSEANFDPSAGNTGVSPSSTDHQEQQRLLDLVRSLQQRIDLIDGDRQSTVSQVPPPPYAPPPAQS